LLSAVAVRVTPFVVRPWHTRCAKQVAVRVLNHLFAQKGFDETTLDDIPQVAGVSRRCPKSSEGDLTANILAGLTLSILGVTFRSWFDSGQQDISVTTAQAFATLGRLIYDGSTGRANL
jgi:hypothetical protein